MPLVSKPFSFACLAERLAWTRTRPDRLLIAPAGKTQGVAPNPDTGEEMALDESSEVGGSNISNVPLIDFPGRDGTDLDELAQPRRGLRVVLVVVGGHSQGTLLCEMARVR
jgi:hypothetical protein